MYIISVLLHGGRTNGSIRVKCASGYTNGSVNVVSRGCAENLVETVERRSNTGKIIDWAKTKDAKAVTAWARHIQRCCLCVLAVKAFRRHRCVCIIGHEALGNIAFKVDKDQQALGLTVRHRADEHGIAHRLGDMHHLDISVVNAGAGLSPAVIQLGVQKACTNGSRRTGMLHVSHA